MFRTGKTKQRVLSVKTSGWQRCDACGQLHKTAPCGNRETLHYREENGNSSPPEYGYLDGVSLPNEFNEILQDAMMFRLIQISEESRKLSESFKAEHNSVPWSALVGLRNRIVHDYGNVDLTVVYDTLSVDIPVMKKRHQNIRF